MTPNQRINRNTEIDNQLIQHHRSEVLAFMHEKNISSDYLLNPSALMEALIGEKAPTELIDLAIAITAKTTMR